HVYAGSVELSAPVLEQLELSRALRYDNYESGEGKATPKFGVQWTPVDWVALRAPYAEGVRAPNPGESGDGGLAAGSAAGGPG
ncbi:TonB-dependent receptor domain-containing protein, partial [Stenotrophomonas sp. SrG]|uniref:TonB-dependent receptor domain-containing protein n=1 Tax=Stenotrophomonas sp. SrG TaxID=3414430 RepID=UPI003CF519D2